MAFEALRNLMMEDGLKMIFLGLRGRANRIDLRPLQVREFLPRPKSCYGRYPCDTFLSSLSSDWQPTAPANRALRRQVRMEIPDVSRRPRAVAL
jgi:hypothetical protein